MEDTRIHFIGDELIAGYGDGRALGWTGRVMARTRGVDAITFMLTVPRETTAQLAERWQSEVARRSLPGGINRLVVGIGTADVAARISPARSRLSVANILDKAADEHRSCFVVGPPPLPSVNPDATAALSRAVGEVCARRGIPFVDTFEPLRNHEQWMNDVTAAGRDHPGQAGYGLRAWLVLHRGWYEWLGVEQPD